MAEEYDTKAREEATRDNQEPLLLPMSTFDPSVPCKVHELVNNCFFDWKPEWAAHYREYAEPYDTAGTIAWDGLLLNGWTLAEETRCSP